jgi:alcohol dehydrogenase class IV
VSITRFAFHVPTRITFGRGAADDTGTVARQWGDHVLVVCGQNAMKATGILDRVMAGLHTAGVKAQLFDRITANPRSDDVDRAADIVRDSGIRAIVGLGGGSVLDAAKAIAAGVAHGPVGPLVGQTLEPRGDCLPVIAIPTTAGSGAEVTPGATITDVERGLKSGIRGDDLSPRVALVDPGLGDTVPHPTAMAAGFDALAHAIEGYLARRRSPLTEDLAERAIRSLSAALPRRAGGDTHASLHDAMSLAALLGGLNVATAGTCLPHRMQQAMATAARPGPSHGEGLAVLYPAWLDAIKDVVPDRLAVIAGFLGGTDARHEIVSLTRAMGLNRRLRDVGYTPADISGFTARLTGNLDNDPHTRPTRDVAESIYQAAY